ncbi:Monocarboxylate transporter 10 [Exaiptasia diaphana]|nr:Monocarboxylate transporter 10 [Exaiptasia diaphana]
MAGCCTRSPHKQDGWWAWLVCLCAVISVTVTIGISNCFAVPLPVLLLKFKETKQRLGWLGSMATSVTFLATPLAGFFSKRFGFRATSLVGCITCSGGLVMTSFLNSVPPMYFSYGVLYGLGSCFLHTGSVFAVTAYFNKQRPFATGILSSAHSIGFIAFGPLMQVIIDVVGWRNMYRIMAALFALLIVLVVTFDPNVKSETLSESEELMSEQDLNEDRMKKKVKEKIQKQKFTLVFFKDPGFIIAVICLTIGTFGTVVCFVHLVSYI